MKKSILAVGLAAALVSGAFAGENHSFDLYGALGTNQNFVAGGDIEINSKRYVSGSFKSIDDKQIYQVSINTLIHNDYKSLQIGNIGAGLLINDSDNDVKFKPMLTGSYAFDGYAVDGYFADSYNYGGSIVKGLWSKGIGERKALNFVCGLSYDKIQGDSENSIFLRINYLFGGN
ncbi:hypothetical protein RZR97_02730 [Hydrogenimonas thermophila]|uniref:hypothetical protein n=1 Tax=Hydrogenimonas thermophila TaxID=223786 RepID=UPI002936E6A4|nr:hypothetical protein [Hydrogenimonas thermophila]WOE70495.1 hypothetical protein RZR91_02745 [Hydrogenimonas thermophila]WOE73012.1 hypothetical protein RZR97_02730 [Hydrogenimonas thermophila]